MFIGRSEAEAEAEAPVLWPPDGKTWLRKVPEARKDWRQEEKGDNRGRDGWMASPTGWTSFSTLQEMQDGKPGCFSPWGRQEPNTSEVLNNNCSSPHPSHIIISGLSLALAINLNAQHVKLSLKCLHILQSLRIFPHYYTALSTILVSNPKFSPIPTGFHWLENIQQKPTSLIQRKFSTLVSDHMGYPGGSVGNLPANEGATRDGASIPESRTPRIRKCNPPQYSCLENPMDSRAWWATLHGVSKSEATEHSNHSIFLLGL